MEQKKKAGEESLANIASTLAQRKESLKAMRETIRTELQNVLPTATSRQNIDSTKVVKIRINFPNGEKLDNCFSPTDTTEVLVFVYIYSNCFFSYCLKPYLCMTRVLMISVFLLGTLEENSNIIQHGMLT
jgi:hypothetical protein